ncbi:MAG TPA: hypothetical protein PKM82_07265 [Acidovorax sp.]|nr:hypothetical protein [Acidovorax sp.]
MCRLLVRHHPRDGECEAAVPAGSLLRMQLDVPGLPVNFFRPG